MARPTNSIETEAEQAERLRQTAASERVAFFIDMATAIFALAALVYALIERR